MDELEQQQEQQQEQETQTEVTGTDAALSTEGEQAPDVKAEASPPEEDIETLKKRLADTQAWAHERNKRALELERMQEAKRLEQIQAGLEPGVLDVVDQAIQAREIKAKQDQERKSTEVREAVLEAVPDFSTLQANPIFAKALNEQAEALVQQGMDPMKPTLAVRAVMEAKRQYEQSQARAAAEEAERTRKTSKMAAMNVPGSGAAAQPSAGKTPEQLAAEVWNMSPEEFAKLQKQARGF